MSVGWYRWVAGLALLALFTSACLPLVPVERDAVSGEVRTAFERHSVAYGWMRTMLVAIAANPPHATATTWRVHVTTASMFEAWAAYDPQASSPRFGDELRRPIAERTPQNADIAVSYAAHRALSWLYPRQSELFDTALEEVLDLPPYDGTDRSRPAGVGNLAALTVIDDRLDDGANALEGFRDTTSMRYPALYQPVDAPAPDTARAPGGPAFDPNRWQPLRVASGTLRDRRGWPVVDDEDHRSYRDQEFLTPHWGAVRPFALASGDVLRPPAPPQYGSDEPYTDALGNASTGHEAWVEQVREVVEVGAELTEEQQVIAELWEDGPQTYTPPGHWVQLALGICIRDEHGLDEDVHLFYALGGALLDAGIATWEAKRHYDYIRPVSAIQHHFHDVEVPGWLGPDRGTGLLLGQHWRPYQRLDHVTPPFPEFPSGHSAFSHAAAVVLEEVSGTDRLYDGTTRIGEDHDGSGQEDLLGEHRVRPGGKRFEGGPDREVVLRWETVWDAAEESARSRIYGGIHIRDGDHRAREIGIAAGQRAAAVARAHVRPAEG